MNDQELMERLKAFIQRECPDHIREYTDGWHFAACGHVWYDADDSRDTFDEAVVAMVSVNVSECTAIRQKAKRQQVEIENQKLKVENEALKLQVLELRAGGYHGR